MEYFTIYFIKPASPITKAWQRHFKKRRLPTNISCVCVYVQVQFSHSVVSNPLQPHGLQHASLPCPPPTPRTCSNSCPSSRWCHSTISSSGCPLLLLPSIFPSSEQIKFTNIWKLHIPEMQVCIGIQKKSRQFAILTASRRRMICSAQ